MTDKPPFEEMGGRGGFHGGEGTNIFFCPECNNKEKAFPGQKHYLFPYFYRDDYEDKLLYKKSKEYYFYEILKPDRVFR
jgi:hypothetical protein